MNKGFFIKASVFIMSYTWKIANRDEFPSIYEMLVAAGLWLEWGIDGINRRITDPIKIGHLITFYDESQKLCGFLTIAHMGEDSEGHQKTYGVLPQDWRSGKNLWVVDLVAPYGGCMRMLRALIKSVNPAISKSARYLRKKTMAIREVRFA